MGGTYGRREEQERIEETKLNTYAKKEKQWKERTNKERAEGEMDGKT